MQRWICSLNIGALVLVGLLLLACGGGGGGGAAGPGESGEAAGPGEGDLVDALCSKPLENPLELPSTGKSFSVSSSGAAAQTEPLLVADTTSSVAPNRLIVQIKSAQRAPQSMQRASQTMQLSSVSAPSQTVIAGISLSSLGGSRLQTNKSRLALMGVSGANQQAFAQAVSNSSLLYIANVSGGKAALEKAREKLLNSGQVQSVEYDFQLSLSTTAATIPQSGAAASASSSAGSAAQPFSADRVEAKSAGSTHPIVAVIDTGIYASHPELANNMWRNPNEIAGNGMDDDGDGIIDNLHGADVVTMSADTTPYPNTSANNHGTQVAGVVRNATRAAQELGTQVKIMALKVQGSNGLIYTSDVIRAQNFILQKKLEGHNVVAVNRSMGCYSCASFAMQASLLALNQAGILVVNAAGNESRDTGTANFYPSAYRLPGVISVAAHDPYGKLASFSNYGNQVDIAALGDAVTTTSGPNGRATVRGTSFAAPYVAGVVAMVKAQNPNLNLASTKMRVLARGYDSGQNPGCQLYGLVPSNKLASVKLSLAPAACANPVPTIIYPVEFRSTPNSYWGDMRAKSQNIFTAGASHVLAAQVEVCTGQTQGLNFASSDGQIVAARDDGVYPDKLARDGLYTALYTPTAPTPFNEMVRIEAVHLLGNQEIKSEHRSIQVAQSGMYRASIANVAFQSIATTGRRLPFTLSSSGYSQGSDENVVTPFPVFFSGSWQNEFYVSNSGRICFQYALAKYNKGAFCNAPPWHKDAFPNGWRLSDGNASNNQTILGMIAPWWDSQWGNGNTGIFVQTLGSAPSRTFIVSWEGMKPTAVANNSSATASFQLVFHEGQPYFHMVYGNTVIGNYGPNGSYNMDNGVTATVGLQHYTGKTGLTLSYQRAGSAHSHGVFSNRSYRFEFIPNTFSDVPARAASPINAVVAASVADGCASNQYCPQDPLTRAQAAAWIGRVVFGNDWVSDFHAPATSQFVDVPNTHPYYRHIHATQSLGAFALCGVQSFCPDAAVTSMEVSEFVYRRLAPFSQPDLIPAGALTRQQATQLVEGIARPQDFYY